MLLLIAILLFLLVLRHDIRTDYRKWLKGLPVLHTNDALYRTLLMLPAFVFFLLAHGKGDWRLMVSIICMLFFTYWLLFDGLYNKVRGYGWWFTGSDDPDDAATDNFLQNIPHWLHVTIKLTGTAGSIAAYILC